MDSDSEKISTKDSQNSMKATAAHHATPKNTHGVHTSGAGNTQIMYTPQPLYMGNACTADGVASSCRCCLPGLFGDHR